MRLHLDVRRTGIGFFACNLMALSALGQGGTATEPVPREGPWMTMHRSFLDRAAKGDVDLLFVGDSITQGWHQNDTWKRFYGPRKAANFGIGGDRTQHVLWRLDNGEVDSIRPKVAVVMIGTNNVASNTPEEIAAGIKAIVGRLRSKLPETKVLLLGVFPRGASRAKDLTVDDQDPRIAQINGLISGLDDGKSVKYLDIGKHFLDGDGKVPKSLMPDFLHLSEAGYRTWADAIEPTLWEMMETK